MTVSRARVVRADIRHGRTGPAFPLFDAPDRRIGVLGVNIWDTIRSRAVDQLGGLLTRKGGPTCSVYFVNTHTLNLATEDAEYRALLNRAGYVFGDGTGVRWASHLLHDKKLQDNVNGTDLVPELMQRFANKGLSYFLLGATPEQIATAQAEAQRRFGGWELAGHHHGYLDDELSEKVVRQINEARPNLLMVGMGNPIQERWLDRYGPRLEVPVSLAVGGLFTYWSGDIERAPRWVRQLGHEWLHLLVSQPHKAKRYLIGNPKFLARVARSRASGLRWPSS